MTIQRRYRFGFNRETTSYTKKVAEILLYLVMIFYCMSCKDNSAVVQTLVLNNKPQIANGDSSKIKNVLNDDRLSVGNQIGLADLRQGADSFECRFWYKHSLGLYGNVVVLKVNKQGWKAELTDTRESWDYYKRDYKVTAFRRSEVMPVSGWDNLIDSINAINVLSFSGSDEYNSVEPGADGDSFVIEIAKKGRYDVYCFIDPSSYKTKYLTAKKLVLLYNLLEQAFSFKFGHYQAKEGTE